MDFTDQLAGFVFKKYKISFNLKTYFIDETAPILKQKSIILFLYLNTSLKIYHRFLT